MEHNQHSTTNRGRKPRSKNRPLEIRIAEQKARLARLEGRSVSVEAESHPAISVINRNIAIQNNLALKYQRWTDTYEESIQALQDRIEQWASRRDDAESQGPTVRADLARLKEVRDAWLQRIANGQEIPENEIERYRVVEEETQEEEAQG
jgi:plasmid maintenance system antidote protein VapI